MHNLLHEELDLCRLFTHHTKEKEKNIQWWGLCQTPKGRSSLQRHWPPKQLRERQKGVLYYGGDQLGVLVEVCGLCTGVWRIWLRLKVRRGFLTLLKVLECSAYLLVILNSFCYQNTVAWFVLFVKLELLLQCIVWTQGLLLFMLLFLCSCWVLPSVVGPEPNTLVIFLLVNKNHNTIQEEATEKFLEENN